MLKDSLLQLQSLFKMVLTVFQNRERKSIYVMKKEKTNEGLDTINILFMAT